VRPCQTGYIDYDKLEEKALDFRPKMIICGGSAYPREWDYKRLYTIASKIGALLMCDMAHYRRARPAPPPARPWRTARAAGERQFCAPLTAGGAARAAAWWRRRSWRSHLSTATW